MNSSAGRSIEVDLLRGIVLIAIAIDHISVSVLSHATLHNYAYCDAAEVFVFLGGYASAAGYTNIAARRGEGAARRRFLKRAWEIYRAYLLTAALMLVCGAVVASLPIASPLVAESGWPGFAHRPLQGIVEIATLRRQPFLSAVLPMYLLYALSVSVVVPLARRMPVALFAGSLAVWLGAPWLAAGVLNVADWPFNPFAWQMLFMLGVLCRLHPVPARTQTSNVGHALTAAAFAVVLTFMFVKVCIDSHPSPGYMKQNLASVRIVSFLALAWLCAQAARLGWIRTLAERLPAVVTVGKQGLVCFVGGTAVSIVVDAGIRLAHADTNWFARLAGDIVAVSALLAMARIAAAPATRLVRVSSDNRSPSER
ncbi:OpgC domain-containing protein [Trinickia dinghuensis]|uniref:OpgC domain-containing protein n=1 Tax=Trinickia dinghuensis TaxID=2291023 RepID=A0A3D8JS43_9BURK|nr:OpgC domain-containing protein [Trinickia dinghuensis]RDU95710.1 OpgC domain-containing protein [Trinickia dinghuensis]